MFCVLSVRVSSVGYPDDGNLLYRSHALTTDKVKNCFANPYHSTNSIRLSSFPPQMQNGKHRKHSFLCTTCFHCTILCFHTGNINENLPRVQFNPYHQMVRDHSWEILWMVTQRIYIYRGITAKPFTVK